MGRLAGLASRRRIVKTVEDSLRRLEKLPVPVAAAINGAALGGGFELTLACNYRVAWDDRSVGEECTSLAVPRARS